MRHKPMFPPMSRLNPLHINLKELPPEGQDFTYSEKSGELTPSLRPLVGTNAYVVQFKIIPMGNTYKLQGTASAAMDLQCSLCAIDFKCPITLKLHELLVVNKKQPLGKNDQQIKTNHAHEWETQGPDYIILDSDTFQIADYIHEMIALAEPLKPLGKPNCDENCDNLKDRVQRDWLIIGDVKETDPIKTNPFQVLEKIKLKS